MSETSPFYQLFDHKYDFLPELKLQFTVDPSRDYRAEIELELPSWEPEPYERAAVSGGAALNDNTAQREKYDARRRKFWQLGHLKYIHALDPAGNICAMTISSCRPGPGHEDGDDRCGTESRVKHEKMQRGWLPLDADGSFGGFEGQRYLAWVLDAVRPYRRAKYEADQRKQSAEFADRNAAAQREQSRMAVDMIEKQGEQTASTLQQMIQQLTAAVTALAEKDDKPRGKHGKSNGE